MCGAAILGSEMLAMQGFDICCVDAEDTGLSQVQMANLAGNALLGTNNQIAE